MRIIGCDLHARQQTLAILETTTGEVVNRMLLHEGNHVRESYSTLPRPVLVGIEATGSTQWFLRLLDQLGIESKSVIRPRFLRRNLASKNMTGAMRT